MADWQRDETQPYPDWHGEGDIGKFPSVPAPPPSTPGRRKEALKTRFVCDIVSRDTGGESKAKRGRVMMEHSQSHSHFLQHVHVGTFFV